MCIALMGGMERLEPHYRREAERLGMELRVFNTSRTDILSRLRGVDLVLILTGRVSHRLRTEAMKAAKAHNIPVIMEHGCGLCSFRDTIACLGCRQNPSSQYPKGEHCHA
jgi:hypothetical protein